jgi:Ala-tRNA(Pro) deacylase
MAILTKLREFLDQQGVRYEVRSHRQAFTAQEVAEAQQVPGMELAKVVIVRSGGEFAMLVLPAPYRVDLERARTALGHPDLVLAHEHEFTRLFPECEPGAMPPFGNLYGLAVWVDEVLTKDEEIVFNAGTHTQTVTMRYADFARLVQPRVAGLDVRTWMTPNPETVQVTDTLALAREKMERGRFRRLPVVDAKGKLVAMLTERDLRQHVGYLPTTRVDAAMEERVVTIRPDECLERAVELMLERKIGGLPVVDDGGALVGIITESDCLRALLEVLRKSQSPGSTR